MSAWLRARVLKRPAFEPPKIGRPPNDLLLETEEKKRGAGRNFPPLFFYLFSVLATEGGRQPVKV